MKKLAVIGMKLCLGGCGMGDPPDGEKIGQIVKVAQEGILVSTWEAQLIRGGISGGNGSFGVQPFDFTVPQELVGDVQRAVESQTEVLIRYHKPFIYSLFATESGGYYLVSIRAAK